MTWKDRRALRIRLVQVTLSVATAAVVFGVPYLATRLIPETAPGKAALRFLSRDTTLSQVLLYAGSPAFVAAYATFVWKAFKAVRRAAEHLHDRFLAAFNTDVLRPVGPPPPLDPLRGSIIEDPSWRTLGWVKEAGSPRADIWAALTAFVEDGIGDGRQPWWGQDTSLRSFRWAVLAGQSGSGKSRMAVELARHYARSDTLGEIAALKPGWAARRARMAAWLRNVCPPLSRRPTDPWDAGLVQGGDPREAATWSTRQQIEEGWLARFREWLPRRPTILILDDPRPNDSGALLAALNAAKAAYRYPVRLVITNQAYPKELGLSPVMRPGAALYWETPVAGFSGTALALTSQAAMTEAELRLMALRAGLPVRSWQGSKEQVQALRRVTRGNPLLLELALHQVREGRPVRELTETGLVQDRAVRVIRALQDAGIGTDAHLELFCVATLAGGDSVANQVPRPGALTPLGTATLDRVVLARTFSLEQSDVDHLPPIRPERIGDGFVRQVIAELKGADPGLPRRVVDAAWVAGPRTLLRSLPRLLDAKDDLAAALASGPPDTAAVDAVAVALAYAEAAIVTPIEDWHARAFDDGAAALSTALRRIGTVSPGAALTLMDRIPALSEVSSLVAVARGPAGIACFAAAADRALAGAELDTPATATAVLDCATRALAALRRWGATDDTLPSIVRPALPTLVARLAATLGAGHAGWRAWLEDNPGTHSIRMFYGDLLHPLGEAARRAPGPTQRTPLAALRIAIQSAAMRGDKGFIAATFADLVARSVPGDEAILADGEEARAAAASWHWIAYGSMDDPDASQSAYAELDRFVASQVVGASRTQVDDLRQIRLERVRTAAVVLFAWTASKNLSRAHDVFGEMNRQIDEEGSLQPGFEIERLFAWRSLAFGYSSTGDLSATKRVVVEVSGLVDPVFTGQRDFELERIQAEGYAAAVCANTDDGGVWDALDGIDRRIDPTFTGQRAFELERVRAWSTCAVARSRGADTARTQDAVDVVLRIIQPAFTGEREFELARVEAGAALTTVKANAGSAGYQTALDMVEHTIDPAFTGRRDFEVQRAYARRGRAYLVRHDASRHSEAVAALRSGIPAAFKDDPEFLAIVAEAESYRLAAPHIPK